MVAHADTAVAALPAQTVQTAGALVPARNIDPADQSTSSAPEIVDDSALMPQEGPAGTEADIVRPKNATITVYVVKPGDTVSGIAALFNVNGNTIRWANGISKAGAIQSGQNLVILPVDGIPYVVKSGDTLASIAKKYGGNADDIASFNGVDDSTLVTGVSITIPDGEEPAPETPLKAASSAASAPKKGSSPAVSSQGTGTARYGPEPAHDVGPAGTASQISYYIAPLASYIKTQGIHGYNAVDLAAPSGTAIRAAADGTVIVARDDGGWNGGYGNYVVIEHDNGSQTLYAHMSSVSAEVGETVSQGDVIGKVGMTGEATGPHVHFEIRNGIKNPF